MADAVLTALGIDPDAPLDLLFAHARAEGARAERERYEALGGWLYAGDDPYDYRFHYEDEEPEPGEPTSRLFQLRADQEAT